MEDQETKSEHTEQPFALVTVSFDTMMYLKKCQGVYKNHGAHDGKLEPRVQLGGIDQVLIII